MQMNHVTLLLKIFPWFPTGFKIQKQIMWQDHYSFYQTFPHSPSSRLWALSGKDQLLFIFLSQVLSIVPGTLLVFHECRMKSINRSTTSTMHDSNVVSTQFKGKEARFCTTFFLSFLWKQPG